MGRSVRKRPKRLSEKLLAIRKALNLSQAQLVIQLTCEDYPMHRADVSNYELGKSEPPLVILLRYARVGGVSMEYLVDDDQ